MPPVPPHSREWYAACVPGFASFLAGRAREAGVPDARAKDGSSIRFSAESPPPLILSCCRSVHRILAEAPPPAGSRPASSLSRGDRQEAIRELSRGAALLARSPSARRAIALEAGRLAGRRGPLGFVLRAFGPDDPLPLEASAKDALTRAIAELSGGRPDSRHPAREYRVQGRADGSILLLSRPLDRPAPELRPGELPPDTARLLVELSRPRPDDVFLDPCAGHGSIPRARAAAGPFSLIFAGDADPAMYEEIRAGISSEGMASLRKRIFPKLLDARSLEGFDDGFITALVSDPPWGLYGGGGGPSRGGELDAFYRSFLAASARVLASTGRLVLLAARDIDLDGFMRKAALPLEAAETHEVLISGKKATAGLWVRS